MIDRWRYRIALAICFAFFGCESPTASLPDYRPEKLPWGTYPPIPDGIDSTYCYYQNIQTFNRYLGSDTAYIEYRIDSIQYSLVRDSIHVAEAWFQFHGGVCGDIGMPVFPALLVHLDSVDSRIFTRDFGLGNIGHRICQWQDIYYYDLK